MFRGVPSFCQFCKVVIKRATRCDLVEVLPDEDELAKLGERHLIPGMPVEVFIQTDKRTALNYLQTCNIRSCDCQETTGMPW